MQNILRNRQDDPETGLAISMNLRMAALSPDNPSDVRTWPGWEPLIRHVAFDAS
ncbi:MAG: hypothetical protein KDB27_12310 [Planctomycetales bacterium]|nr:hypothetical protein [Planctomycetales bacterium]